MGTKNTKSPGNLILGQTKEYWTNAAKQFIWPIDFEHNHILVPEKDFELISDNLMIAHFRAAGWHIQSAIDVKYTKPYQAPETNHPIFKPIKKVEQKDSEFKCNQRFKIKSNGYELKITSIDKKAITLSYIDIDKSPIITNFDNLSKSLKMGVFIEL